MNARTVIVPEIELPDKLAAVFEGEADVRGAYGGRGSGKTRSFAKMAAIKAWQYAQAGIRGIILCGRQYMNSLDESSLEEVKTAIRSEPWLEPFFDIGEKYVRTVDGRVSFKFTGLERNIESLKSKSRILLCWVDEAEPVTESAWQTLIPTLREEVSELWVTWNPKSKKSPTHKRFRETKSDRIKVVEINWRDNPWFPAKLERTRLDDAANRPDSYPHVWEGAFATVVEGAYFAKHLAVARAQNRIGRTAIDPLMTIRAYWDIGGTGHKADATAIWIVQFINRQIICIDHYEAVGQDLGTHILWLRSRGYGSALCKLPHDGANHEKVTRITYAGALREAGFDVEVMPNAGAGAAILRIEAARRRFPSIWFDAERCEGGIEALAHYHEKKDADRGIGLGPNHDWASHSADAFGGMCMDYEAPDAAANDDWNFEPRKGIM